MNEDKITKMLDTEYSVTLKGSMLGYLLSLLADAQRDLNNELRGKNIDPITAMACAANNVVGNAVMHEVYRVCGADFLAFAMKADSKGMKDLMEAETEEEMDKAASVLRASKKAEKAKASSKLH